MHGFEQETSDLALKRAINLITKTDSLINSLKRFPLFEQKNIYLLRFWKIDF